MSTKQAQRTFAGVSKEGRNICAVPRAYAVKAAGRTKEKQAALGAEKLGGDESREVVAGGKLVARA